MSRFHKEEPSYHDLPEDEVSSQSELSYNSPSHNSGRGYYLSTGRLLLIIVTVAAFSTAWTAVAFYLFAPAFIRSHTPASSQPQQPQHHHDMSSHIAPSTHTSHEHPVDSTPSQCGASAEEAIALNCTYDPLLVQWLPAHCPHDYVDEFLAAAAKDPIDDSVPSLTGQWRYYYDQAGEQEISGIDELARMPHTTKYWTTESEHRFHCTFVLLRVHAALMRAREGDLVMDAKTLNPSHARHCIFFLSGRAKSHFDDRILTHGNVAYGSC